MTKHYVEYYYPGMIVPETRTREIEKREIDVDPKEAKFYAYRLFDCTLEEVNGELLSGNPKNHSPMTYIGRVMTLEDVKREMPESLILISNMELNGYEQVVKTKFGQCFPVNKEDKVIPLEG